MLGSVGRVNERRPWTLTDRTGGEIDQVVAQLMAVDDSLVIERFQSGEGADGADVWWVSVPDEAGEIQVDTYPDGASPFILEGDDGFWAETIDVDHCVSLIVEWLELGEDDD